MESYSIAAKAGFRAGDKINSVNGVPVKSWSDAQTGIVLDLEAGKVEVAVTDAQGVQAVRTINIAGTDEAADVPKKHGYIGLMAHRFTLSISQVVPESAAEEAGLNAGDVLLSVDGKPLADWQEWEDLVQKSAGQKLQLEYKRGNKVMTAYIRPRAERHNGMLVGKVGLYPGEDKEWSRMIRFQYYPTVAEAFKMGWDKMTGYTTLTLKFFGRLLSGHASLQHVSGPLTIADVAGKSAALGWQPYVEFLALVSVSLGVMNLLPIPVLDGGHLMYYSIEWLRGKPLGSNMQMIGLRIGLALMLAMMILAFFNDITRLFG